VSYWIWVAVFCALALRWLWPVLVEVSRWPRSGDEVLDMSGPEDDPGTGKFGD
jgi:hypothetical protein